MNTNLSSQEKEQLKKIERELDNLDERLTKA